MKKLLCILICIFILSAIPMHNTYAFEFKQNTPRDIDEHWAENSIEMLKDLGIMNGYLGYTNPGSNITRGEFTALITRAFSLEAGTNSKEFTDIPKSHMFYDAIQGASNAGIADGFADGSFRPNNYITREEIMLMVSRLTSGYASNLARFTDISSNYTYISQLSKICEDGIIGGYPDGSFKPYNKTTRAEGAQIIVNAMKKYLPVANIDNVYQFAIWYVPIHYSDTDRALINTLGTAHDDMLYIKNTYAEAKNMGYTVTNSASDVTVISFKQTGPFTEILTEYNLTTTINGLTKTQKAQSKLCTITKNGIHSVFRHETRIIEPNFINLTWEVFSGAPAYSTSGVNIVSPTCFRIETVAEDASHKLNFDGSTLYFNSSLTKEYLNYAKANGYKVWAMYKTDFKTDTASLFLNNNSARKQASSLLLREILKNNLDGINFDFENMYPRDKGAYTNHVKEISLMAHTLGAVVSVDITKYEKTSSNWSMCFDRNSLSKYADYIMLMAYDQYYSGSKIPGPVAGHGWTENCVNLTLNEVPSDKLVLGMPFYIRVWEVKNNKTVSSKAVSMTEAKRLIEEYSAKAQYDSKFELIKYTWKEGTKEKVMWLEDANSIAKRVELARKYSLAGVASWRRGFETMDVWNSIYYSMVK